jgi:hypothetical protein
MIVSFIINPTGGSDHTANYLNFLRCVTAIATATAGTSTITVNPFTASNTINSGFNCIQEIHANAEGGGWLTSTRHAVPASLSNTAVAYTAIETATDWLYVADLYNSSGKSATPWKKLTFHSYNNASAGSTSINNKYIAGRGNVVNNSISRSLINGNGQGSNVLVTFGASSSQDWTDVQGAPAQNNQVQFNNDAYNNRVYTLGANTSGTAGTIHNHGQPLNFGINANLSATQSSFRAIKYTMAVTSDYCIIWENPYVSNTTLATAYTNNEWTNVLRSDSAALNTTSRYAGFVYCGLRSTQAWEDTLTNNVPWVAMQYTPDAGRGTIAGAGTTTNSTFPHNQVAALMHTLRNTGALYNGRGGTPLNPGILTTQNVYNQNYFDAYTSQLNTNGGYTDQQVGSIDWGTTANYRNDTQGNMLDGPLWNSRQKAGSGSIHGKVAGSSNIFYKPVVDPISGTFVPPAIPITISKSSNDDWNQGGVIRGLYKSLSGDAAFMKQFWLSPIQTFTINGEQWWPFIVSQEMFLVRFA